MAEKRRTRGDGAFFQRADGKWMGRVELTPDRTGKRRYKWVSSVDRNTCMAKLKQLRKDVEDGKVATTSNTTVGKWLIHWIDNIHSKRKVRPGTIDDYRACINNHIIPAIGKKRVDKLTLQHVRDMHDAIGPCRTAELAHVILRKAMKDAVAESVAPRNVVALVDKPEYAPVKRQGLPEDTAQHVLTTALSIDTMSATRIITGFLTGARRGELLGLRWSHVNLEAGVMDIAWQLQQLKQKHGCGIQLAEPSPLARKDRPQKPPYWPCGRSKPGYCPQRYWDLPAWFEYEMCERSLLFTRPKTEAGSRLVPLVAPLVTALHPLRDAQPNPHNLVWHNNGKPIDPRRDYELWRTAFRAANLIGPDESLPPHVSRHTTATLLRAAGVDEQTRLEILGHATVDSQRVYAHADRERHLSAMGNLAQLLG